MLILQNLGFRPMLFNKGVVPEWAELKKDNGFRPMLFNKDVVLQTAQRTV